MVEWMSKKLHPYEDSIFATMSQLAVQHGSVNFGQGFPDFDGPELIRKAACEAVMDGRNQYAPMPGVRGLRQQLAQAFESHYGLVFDPDRQISILAGATQAMYASLAAITNAGDRFIVFEPCYDAYIPVIQIHGGEVIPVRLHPPDFTFDPEELARAFQRGPRGVIINSPHNPTGRVFTRGELETIAKHCRAHDVLAVTDEVYEHLTFDCQHIPLATLPEMAECTLTISSSAKTFSLTGWKIGWVAGPEAAIQAVRKIHQFNVFAVATPFQHAIARGFANRHSLIKALQEDLRAKRDFLCAGLTELGFRVLQPQGTFFVVADFSEIHGGRDVDFARQLITGPHSVATIPVSVFAKDPSSAPQTYLRFCFAKNWDTLKLGLQKLGAAIHHVKGGQS